MSEAAVDGATGEGRATGSAVLCWLGALLVALAGLVHANALRGPFVFDDLPAIVDNPHIESLSPLSRALSAPPGTGASGRPLVALSLAVNYAVGGRDPFGYHLFNVAAHVCAALALFGLVRRTLSAWKRAPRIDPCLFATLVAGLWVLHPLHGAALHHVIYRSEVLVALFYLSTLYFAAVGFVAARPAPWFLASVLACALGACSKEVIVSAPLVVLLYDRTFVSGGFAAALRRHRSLYAGLASTWILLAWVVSSGDRGASVGLSLEGVSPTDYLMTQAGVLVHYARLALWPDALVFDYDGWPVARSLADVWLAGLAVLAGLGLSLAAVLRGSAAGFLGSAVFLVLAPSSSFVPLTGALVAEHRTYLALAALIALAVGAAAEALARVRGPKGVALPLTAAVLLAAVASGAATVQRNRVFSSRLRLWQDTVEKRPDNARAWNGYGVALAAEGRLDEARAAYRRTLALEPRHFKAEVNLGNLALAGGDLAEAMEHYARAAAIEPASAEARSSLGSTLVALGRAAEGVPELQRALELGLPPALRAPARQTLAWALATTGDDAVRDGAQALRLARELDAATGGANPRVLDALAAAYAELGRFDEALATAARALEIAEASGRGRLAGALRAHRERYLRGEPWREPGP